MALELLYKRRYTRCPLVNYPYHTAAAHLLWPRWQSASHAVACAAATLCLHHARRVAREEAMGDAARDFGQLQPHFVDAIQRRYELIRPLVLFNEGTPA